MINCQKLHETAEGLVRAPYPGEVGQRIYDHISQKAWNLWLAHQTMLINEYRLNLTAPKAREFLEKEMLAFLFSNAA